MDVHAIHNILILLHAASATISFFAGCLLVFFLRRESRQQWFHWYWWTLVGMMIFLSAAMLAYWNEYSGIERLIFPGLWGLGIYMLYRAGSAGRVLQSQSKAWSHDAIEHIGFTLISLFEGFIIVTGLNSGLPGWLVAVLAILGVLGGRAVLGFMQHRTERDSRLLVKQ